jgi:hypothetical protein
MKFLAIALLAALICHLPAPVLAQAKTELDHQGPVKTKSARAKGKSHPTAQTADRMASEAAPCARGAWKDDPVCFGEGAADALPTPSGKSDKVDGAATEASIKPTANINPRPSGPGPYQAGVVYQSNGNAVTSNVGGGVSLQLPF